jgi:hypothetical protein
MKSLTALAAAGAVTLGVVGLGVYTATQPSPKETAPHLAVVDDGSGSLTSGCEALGGLLAQYLESDLPNRFSTAVILATGDARSNDEPVQLARFRGLKNNRFSQSRKAAQDHDRAIVQEAMKACAEHGTTDRSPIYLAARRAIEELRALGCDGKRLCTLLIHSDLAENAEAGIRRALLGENSAELPSKIDNHGIDVHICGPAETSGSVDGKGKAITEHKARGAKRADLTEKVWRLVFAEPTRLTIEPHCPKVHGAATAEGKR